MESNDAPRESGSAEARSGSDPRPSWFRSAVRAGVPVLAVAAVVAVAATGAGLLVPGADLPGSTRQTLRIGGLVVAALGLVALVIYRKRHPVSPGQSDPMTTALMAAAAIMAALALLSLPFSPGLTFSSDSPTEGDDGLTDPDGDSGSTTGAGDTTTGGTGDSGTGDGGDSSLAVDENTRFTVAVDRATGETTPIAIDPDSGRAFAFDPETGATTPLTFDSAGSLEGDSGLAVPVGVDRTTGEVGIVGIVNRQTGEVGIIGGAGSGVDLGELDPDTLDGLAEVTGTDLEKFASRETRAGAFGTRDLGVIGTIDPGRRPDGQIDLSEFDFSDVQLGGPTRTDQADLDWDRIAREIEDTRLDETGGGDPRPGTADGDSTAPIDDRRSFDSRMLLTIAQLALLALAVMLVVRLRGWQPSFRRLRRPAEPGLPVDAQDAEAGLTASLQAVTDTGDPRERIVAAYLRLLEALDAAGTPRLAQEAPHEHLDRVLTPLGVRPDPLHRLAELFVMARFSDHPITEHHRTAAADALRLSLASLREATDRAAVAEQPAATGARKR